MTTTQRLCLAGLLAISLTACGSSDEGAERTEPPPVEDTVFGDAVGSMDNARAVEDLTHQHKEDLDRAVQQSEGADAN